MSNELIAMIVGVIGIASMIFGGYKKGRKDKGNEIKADNLEEATDAKERLESIKSIDNDDDYIKRVRDNEG